MENILKTNIPEEIIRYYKKVEEEHKHNIQIYQSLFYQNPEAVFSVDLEGNFTSANETMAIKGECSQEFILQENFRKFIHPLHLAKALAKFDLVKKGIPQDFELRAITAKGTQLDIIINSLPIYVDGIIVGIYGIVRDITEQKRVNKQMKQALANLEKANIEKDNILESITEGFFAINNKWNFLYCNKVIERIWGIDKQEILGRNFWELVDVEKASEIGIEFKRAMELKVRVKFELFYKPLHIWLEITAYPTDNGLSSIVRVINEEKRVEQLFTLEKRALELNIDISVPINEIVELLINGIHKIHTDMTCTLMEVREGALYTWYSPTLPNDYKKLVEGFPIGSNNGSCGTAAFIKQTVIVDDIQNSTFWEGIKDVAARFGFKACWSLPLFDKNKEVFATFGIYYHTVKKPSAAEMNSLEKVRNLLTTIILNKEAEENILLSKERYDIVAKATNDAIWDCDLNTRKVIWNNGITSIFGHDESTIQNTIEWGLEQIHPEDKLSVIEKLLNHIETQENAFSDEFRCLCADGTYKYVQNKVFIITDNITNKPKRIIGALQDVTIQKNTELQLRTLNETLKQRADQLAVSNTELERFAYVASHDLQEPLRTITSFLQLFKRKYANKIDETADNYITFAVDGAERMKQLIMDMLEYSRVNTQLKTNEDVDMQQVVNEVLFNFAGKIKLSDATIEVSPNLPKVHAVKTQMMQVFQNLISNAIKYQNPTQPPHIKIDVIENYTEWEFSVKDYGIGIDSKFFDKIFIIFQRLHSKTQYVGTGIGLAICKKIIDKHYGRIWVESVAGEGSTFYFTIPKAIVLSK